MKTELKNGFLHKLSDEINQIDLNILKSLKTVTEAELNGVSVNADEIYTQGLKTAVKEVRELLNLINDFIVENC